jgi:hypothetical protein
VGEVYHGEEAGIKMHDRRTQQRRITIPLTIKDAKVEHPADLEHGYILRLAYENKKQSHP